jgi:PTH1 family peptidyl-tRNA hydrolase
MALDRIAGQHGFAPWKKRFHGLVTDGPIGGRRVLLLKPQTYMNDSGQAVGEALRYLKIAEGDVYVFHDEIDLAPSKLKVKAGGGNAGHNGLRSISAHIGNEFVRVRIGVGHPGSKDLVSGYVLHDFAKADAAWLEPMLDAMAAAAGRLAAGDAARFLTDVARALQSDKQAEGAEIRAAAAASPPRDSAPAVPPPAVHPAGERQSKRGSALAENLKKWLRGSRGQ